MASHSHHSKPCTPMLRNDSCSCCCHRISSPRLTHDPDHLAQAIAQLLLQRQQETSLNVCPCLRKSQNLTAQFPCSIERKVCRELEPIDESGGLFSLLTQRIMRLESALRRYPSSAAPTYESGSVRAAAARIIQSRFRAFLARRSRALRHLQQLGRLKAAFLSLKSKFSQSSRVDCQFVSIEAMDLLLKVQSMQDDHSMVKDGKRLITREIVRFLDFIDGIALTRNGVRSIIAAEKPTALGKSYGNVCLGRSRQEILEDLSDRIDRIRGFSNDMNGDEFERFHKIIDDKALTKASIAESLLAKNSDTPRRFKKRACFAENELNSNNCINDIAEDEFDIVEESREIPRCQNDDDDANSDDETTHFDDFVLSSLRQKQATDTTKKYDLRIHG